MFNETVRQIFRHNDKQLYIHRQLLSTCVYTVLLVQCHLSHGCLILTHWPSWHVLPLHPGGQRQWKPPGVSSHVAPRPQGLRSHCLTAERRERKHCTWTTGLCNGKVCMWILRRQFVCVCVRPPCGHVWSELYSIGMRMLWWPVFSLSFLLLWFLSKQW